MSAAVVAITIVCAPRCVAAPIVAADDLQEDLDNLQTLMLALHNYHNVFDVFPKDYFDGATALLSWRVALLPFLDEQELFNQFDLTLPWDHPVNAALLGDMPSVFRSPTSAPGSTDTDYAGGSGPGTMFPGAVSVSLLSVTDGTSNTLMLGEARNSAIPWTKPADVAVGACPTLGGSGFASSFAGAVPFAFVDGGVALIRADVDCELLRKLLLRNDGSAIDPADAIYTGAVP